MKLEKPTKVVHTLSQSGVENKAEPANRHTTNQRNDTQPSHYRPDPGKVYSGVDRGKETNQWKPPFRNQKMIYGPIFRCVGRLKFKDSIIKRGFQFISLLDRHLPCGWWLVAIGAIIVCLGRRRMDEWTQQKLAVYLQTGRRRRLTHHESTVFFMDDIRQIEDLQLINE